MVSIAAHLIFVCVLGLTLPAKKVEELPHPPQIQQKIKVPQKDSTQTKPQPRRNIPKAPQPNS